MKRRTLLNLSLGLLAVVIVVVHSGWLPRADGLPEVPIRVRDAEDYIGSPTRGTSPDAGADALRAVDVRHGEGFVFSMAVGSTPSGYQVFRVDAGGNVAYTFGDHGGGWWRARYAVPVEKVDALRALLAAVDYASLHRGYGAGAQDGTYWSLRVEVAGHVKRVGCENTLPDAVRRLASRVRVDFLRPHEVELLKARGVWHHSADRDAARVFR